MSFKWPWESKDAAEILADALEAWGENGSEWTKGRMQREFGQTCLIGGVDKAAGKRPGWGAVSSLPFSQLRKAKGMLRRAVGELFPDRRGFAFRMDNGSIIAFNDDYQTTFSDVKKVVCHAIKEDLGDE